MQKSKRKHQVFDEAFADIRIPFLVGATTLLVEKQTTNKQKKGRGTGTDFARCRDLYELQVNALMEKLTHGMQQESPETEPPLYEAVECN